MRRMILLSISFLFSANILADATIAQIDKINVGGNGKHGTFVSLMNKTFSECAGGGNPVAAVFMDGDLNRNPNYKEQLSVVLSAKMAEKEVIVTYSDCDGMYPLVQEITLQ